MSEEMNLYKRCKNIFKAHGVDMGGGGGESAPEVENAIETHGLGWTDTEEVEGFDIQWDGNTEGLEYVSVYAAFLAKVSSDLSLIDTIDDLIGATILGEFGEGPIDVTITEDNITTEDNKVFNIEGAVIIAFEDGSFGELNLSKGIWFLKIDSSNFTNRLYKEDSTEEVVHQIDQKYIPGGSGGGFEYDLIIKGVGEAFTVTKGDYNALVTKIRAFEPINGVVWVDQSEEGLTAQCTATLFADVNFSDKQRYIVIQFMNFDGASSQLILMPDNTIVADYSPPRCN